MFGHPPMRCWHLSNKTNPRGSVYGESTGACTLASTRRRSPNSFFGEIREEAITATRYDDVQIESGVFALANLTKKEFGLRPAVLAKEHAPVRSPYTDPRDSSYWERLPTPHSGMPKLVSVSYYGTIEPRPGVRL